MTLVFTAIISSLIGVLVGSLIKHRFTLWREKRKEYNEVAIPLKNKVLEQINKPDCDGINKSYVKALRLRISDSEYKKIVGLHDSYSELLSNSIASDDLGIAYIDTKYMAEILKTLNKINSLLSKK